MCLIDVLNLFFKSSEIYKNDFYFYKQKWENDLDKEPTYRSIFVKKEALKIVHVKHREISADNEIFRTIVHYTVIRMY